MAIIDSTNLTCDGCGVTANHHVLYMPEGWIRIHVTGGIRDFCRPCKAMLMTQIMGLPLSDWHDVPVPRRTES